MDVVLPPLSIQPLVENAVKHGLLSRNEGGTIQLRITRQDGFTRIEVTDNGRGLSIMSQPDEGTTVSFVISDKHH